MHCPMNLRMPASRREIASKFFKNELEIEKAKEKISRLSEENRKLMEEHPFLKPMRGHLKERGPTVPEERAERTDQEGPPAPKKRKRELSPTSRRRKEETQETKRWKNQIRMKLAAGKKPEEELVRKAFFRNLRLGTELFTEEFVTELIKKGLLNPEEVAARRVVMMEVPSTENPISPLPVTPLPRP